MSSGNKAFCLIVAIAMGGVVSDKAVKSWHDVRVKEIQLEQDKIMVKGWCEGDL